MPSQRTYQRTLVLVVEVLSPDGWYHGYVVEQLGAMIHPFEALEYQSPRPMKRIRRSGYKGRTAPILHISQEARCLPG